MPRRGENIRKRKDGRWEGRYSEINSENIRKQRSVYAKTYSEVKEKLYAAKQEARMREKHGLPLMCICEWEKLTFGHIADEWLEKVAATCKYSTYIKYQSLYQKYIFDPLKNLHIENITEQLIEEKLHFIQIECTVGVCKSIKSVIQMILFFASEKYKFPLISINKERVVTKRNKIETFTKSEQNQLFQFLYQDMTPCKMGIILCLFTGLRLGEICALQWQDIDFGLKILYVKRTVQRLAVTNQKSKTQLIIDKPKTIYSQREIPLSDEMLCLLKKFYNCEAYILNGSAPLDPRTYQNRFRRYLMQANISTKNFHVLRHTFATNCVEAGVDVKSLSELLGHSDVKITLNRYVHPTMETKRNYMATISSIYGQYLGQPDSDNR